MRAPLVRVGAVAHQIRGVTYDKEEASSTPRPGYLPVLRAGNITDGGLVLDDLVFVPVKRISDGQLVRRHDVIVAASSGSLDVVGKAAPIREDFKGSFGAFCKVLRPNSKVEPRYFAQFFKTPDYRRRVSTLAAGANINNLRSQHLDEMELPLPSLSAQRRIAEILDKAEALRTERRAVVAQLDTLSQAVFLDFFGDPIQNPHGFAVRPMIHLVDPARPITYGILMPGPDQREGVKYVRVVDMKDGGIDLSAIRRTTQTISDAFRRSLLKPGDLLMSIRGHVGRFAIVPPELDGANITQDTARLAIRGASPIFVRECLRTEGFQRWMAKHTKGVAVRGINLADVKQMRVILPPAQRQESFARSVALIERLRATHCASLASMEAIFAALQHRAFRGQL